MNEGPTGLVGRRRWVGPWRDAGFWRRICLAAMGVVALGLAVQLLHAAYLAFTNFKSGTSGDYARYTNMIWNSAHGRLFLYGLNESYLHVHLSYTLALLGPLFRIWDHPFLLTVVQWAFMAGGAGFLLAAGSALSVPRQTMLAVILFWTGYHFTQSVVLCEFHGVSIYLLLIPALYYCLVARRGMVWLPLALILGLREEAGLMVIPLLLYVAARYRWKAGYWWAAAAAAYVAVACLVIFPWVNGLSLVARRQEALQSPSSDSYWSPAATGKRLVSMGWIFLPVLPFLLWRGWRAMLVIPSLAVALSMASAYGSQIKMRIHYPAVILACLAVAMLQSVREMEERRPRWIVRWGIPLFLCVVTAVSFRVKGYVYGSRFEPWKMAYQRLNEAGVHAIRVATTQVPKEGVAYAHRELHGFLANRADLALTRPKDGIYPAGAVMMERARKLKPDVLAGISNGTWGVRYADERYVVLVRGGATGGNGPFLESRGSPEP